MQIFNMKEAEGKNNFVLNACSHIWRIALAHVGCLSCRPSTRGNVCRDNFCPSVSFFSFFLLFLFSSFLFFFLLTFSFFFYFLFYFVPFLFLSSSFLPLFICPFFLLYYFLLIFCCSFHFCLHYVLFLVPVWLHCNDDDDSCWCCWRVKHRFLHLQASVVLTLQNRFSCRC